MPSWKKLPKSQTLRIIQELKEYKANDCNVSEEEVKELEVLEEQIKLSEEE